MLRQRKKKKKTRNKKVLQPYLEVIIYTLHYAKIIAYSTFKFAKK